MSAPDIFISYARNDAGAAKRFADGFRAEGFEVWWDNALQAGEVFDEAIELALRAAKAVVVLWSPDAVASRWVRAEATLADRNKTLVPALIAPCSLPIVFELTQTPDLSRWSGDPRDSAWKHFLEGVRRLVGSAPAAAAIVSKAPPPKLEQAAIVVLPFANMSGDPEQEYFADGISEDVITDLSQVSALRVISRNSSFAFKGQNIDIPDVSRQLNVSHVLEGSVRKAGNRVRVTAQLIDGSTNDRVWAQRWDRDLDDIFELQDELSQAIVKALKVKLVPAEKKAISSRGTDDPEVYDQFIRAVALQSTFDQTLVVRAIDMYREIVKRDPNFTQAWTALASALMNFWTMEPGLRPATEAEVRGAIRRAQETGPHSTDVATVEAFMACWDYDWETIERTIDTKGLDSGVTGTYRAQNYLTLGRAQAAADAQVERRKLDPLSNGTSFLLQVYLDAAGRLDASEAEYLRGRDLHGARVTMAWRACTRAMLRKDHARVHQAFDEEFEGNNHFMKFRPQLIEVLDQPDKALDILRGALVDPELQDGARQAAIANWAVYYDDDDLALDAIQRGLVDRKHGVSIIEIWMPMLAGIRRTARFKQMLIDIGLAAHWRKTGNWGDFARPLGDDDFEIIA